MENSYALPARRYGNPADIVEYDQMDTLGCRACTKHSVVLVRSVCGESKNAVQKGVPNIGHKCKWFAERG